MYGTKQPLSRLLICDKLTLKQLIAIQIFCHGNCYFNFNMHGEMRVFYKCDQENQQLKYFIKAQCTLMHKCNAPIYNMVNSSFSSVQNTVSQLHYKILLGDNLFQSSSSCRVSLSSSLFVCFLPFFI